MLILEAWAYTLTLQKGAVSCVTCILEVFGAFLSIVAGPLDERRCVRRSNARLELQQNVL